MPVAFQLGFNALLKMPSGVSKNERPCVASKDRRDLVAGVLRVHVEAVHRPIRRHRGRDLTVKGGRRLRGRVTRVACAAVAATNAAIVQHVSEDDVARSLESMNRRHRLVRQVASLL